MDRLTKCPIEFYKITYTKNSDKMMDGHGHRLCKNELKDYKYINKMFAEMNMKTFNSMEVNTDKQYLQPGIDENKSYDTVSGPKVLTYKNSEIQTLKKGISTAILSISTLIS